jgi:hypothetical protein
VITHEYDELLKQRGLLRRWQFHAQVLGILRRGGALHAICLAGPPRKGHEIYPQGGRAGAR